MRVLFVCTGNQCRSAAAEAIMSKLAREAGVEVEVASAGTDAWENIPAQSPTVRAARDQGFDLEAHRSRPVTAELMEADVVLAMADSHVRWLRQHFPAARDRIFLFKPYCEGRDDVRPGDDIPDPVGRPLDVHAACVRDIAQLLGGLTQRWGQK